jgi:hypothetical protein
VIVSASPGQVVEAGQLVRLNATATGQPTLNYSWKVSLAGIPILTLPGASVWWNTVGLLPGLYSLALEVQNGSGTATSNVPVELITNKPADYYTVTPCRVYDSRSAGGALTSGAAARSLAITGLCGIPPSARAVVANITVVSPTSTGYATLFPGNYPTPETSSINFNPGSTRANHAVLQLATDGSGTVGAIAALADNGSVHLVVDVAGYFAAAP